MKQHRRWPAKIPWYFPAVSVVVIAVVIATSVVIIFNQTNVNQRDHINSDLLTIENALKMSLKSTAEFLNVLSEGYVESPHKKLFIEKRLLMSAKHHPELKNILIYDEVGMFRLALQSEFSAVHPNLPTLQNLVMATVTSGSNEMAAPFVGLDSSALMALAAPIVEDFDVTGVAIGIVDFQEFLSRALGPHYSRKYRIQLLDAKGALWAEQHQSGNTALSGQGATKALAFDGFTLTLKIQQYRAVVTTYTLVLAVVCVGLVVGLAFAFWLLGMQNNRNLNLLAELAQADQAKTELIANISHEMRTPLGVIRGFAETLAQGSSEVPPAVATGAIIRNADHMLGLVNDFLDLSKMATGLLEVEMVAFAIHDLVSEVCESFQHQAAAAGIALVCQNHIGAIEVTADPKRVRQILVNLVGNALKFTHKGQITVSLDRGDNGPGKGIVIEVADSGIGIKASDREAIFNRFTQGDASASRSYGGTGLGLAISSRLAELLGGRLDLKESAPGRGSVFRLVIPEGEVVPRPAASAAVAKASQPVAGASAVAQVAAAPAVARILIAEDCLDNQILYREFLSDLAAEITVVNDGLAAVAAVARQKFDLVIMDVQMPALDGYEATRRIRGTQNQVPIIALTAHAMKGERQRCLAAGCQDYFTKPISRETLRQLVVTHLGLATASAPPAAAGSGPIASVLPSLYAEEGRIRKLLPGYLARLAAKVAELEAQVVRLDCQAIGRVAHQLQGSAHNYGYPAIGQVAQALVIWAQEEKPVVAVGQTQVRELAALLAAAQKALAEA